MAPNSRRCKRRRTSVEGAHCISDLLADTLTHVASFLAAPSRALFAVAFSFDESQNDERSSAIIARDEWGTLDFGEIEKDLATKLTDDDLGVILQRIGAFNKLKKLRMTNCVNIDGNGLEPLRGSTTIQQVDLTLVRDHESQKIVSKPQISLNHVLPVLGSIISREGCDMKLLQFPHVWREAKDESDRREFSQFLGRYNEMWDNRGSPICLKCNEDINGDMIDGVDLSMAAQKYTCSKCLKHYCGPCRTDDGSFCLQYCHHCDRHYCFECSEIEMCECDRSFCDDCLENGNVECVCRLLNAARRGDLATVRRHREGGFDIFGCRTGSGMSCILLACKNGHHDLLDYLLEQGADPNDVEHFGGSCLMAAACYRHPECVRCLIGVGADVTYAYSGDNATIIYMTALCFSRDFHEGNLEIEDGSVIRTVELLLDAGAPGNTPSSETSETALQMLQEMTAVEGNIKQERDGLITLLQRAG